MGPRFFLVASRGQMATTWLTSALNAIPGILAVHGTSSEIALLEGNATLGDRLRQLSQVRPADHYGFIHCVNDAMILKSLTDGDLRGLNPSVVQLFRNPIMVMEGMACEIAREWRNQEKYRQEAELMRHQVLAGYWRRNAVNWPESVRHAVVSEDEAVISRLTGLWWRCALEAIEAAGFETILARRAEMGADAPFSRPAFFQFEDYTTKREVFGALVSAICAGQPVALSSIDAAFASPVVNRQRNDPEPDAERVWRAWSQAERDMFATICDASGLKDFFENNGLYRLSFVR